MSMTEKLMNEAEVKKVCGGLSRTTRWRMRRDGLFPKPVKISKTRVAWRECEILQWIEDKVAAREGENG